MDRRTTRPKTDYELKVSQCEDLVFVTVRAALIERLDTIIRMDTNAYGMLATLASLELGLDAFERNEQLRARSQQASGGG